MFKSVGTKMYTYSASITTIISHSPTACYSAIECTIEHSCLPFYHHITLLGIMCCAFNTYIFEMRKKT